MKHYCLILWIALLFAVAATAQNYHAVQGSPYAGSLGVLNNPASIVSTPYKWDLTLLGTQVKNSANLYTIYGYSLLSSPANSQYVIRDGNYSRHADVNLNLNLFNTRIALNRKASIAFGANYRTYINIATSKYNYIDTLGNTNDFLKLNEGTDHLSAKVTGSSWVELFGTYSRTLYDDPIGRLNGGITLKLSRGIAGAYMNMDNVRFTKTVQNNRVIYAIDNANLLYQYSSNFDQWKKTNSTSQNINNILAYTQGGAGIDLGFEYLVKTQAVNNFYDTDDYYEYEWKFGVSLLDIGFNQYKYGVQSRFASGLKANIVDTTLDDKFNHGINSLKDFNDSLATVVNQISGFGGNFKVMNPMRLVVNADRYIYDNFFVNAELSLNIPSSAFKKYLSVKELNLLTVTPRWETKKLGAYLPIQFNNNNNFWIGAAFKAGPLLIGVHNIANLFSKTSLQNGGGYIAFVIRSWDDIGTKHDKRLNCPQ